MYAQKLETLPPPPGVLGSLKAGFEAVSNHVILISLPFLLDIFLWLGPRLGVSKVLSPAYQMVFDQLKKGLSTADEIKQLVAFQTLFNDWLQHFNLVSLVSRLQTFPVGISSLMAKTMPVTNSHGGRERQPVIIAVHSDRVHVPARHGRLGGWCPVLPLGIGSHPGR